MEYILTTWFAKIVSKIYEILNIIIRFTKFRLTLYSVLRFQSTVVVMADQNLLDAINIDEELVGMTQNTPVRIRHESPVQTKEIEKNK